MKWVADATPWLFRFVQDSRSGQPSVKRYGLAVTVTVLCGVLFGLGTVIAYAGVTSSGREQIEIVRIAAGSLEVISGLVLAAVSGSYVADKALSRDKKDESSN